MSIRPVIARWAPCIVAVLLPGGVAIGQPAAPCPRANALAAHTQWLCDELVPADGRVWYRGTDGAPCYCSCLQADVAAMRQARIIANGSRLDMFLARSNARPTGEHRVHALSAEPPRPCDSVKYYRGDGGAYQCPADRLFEDMICDQVAPLGVLDGIRSHLAVRYVRTIDNSWGGGCGGRFSWLNSGHDWVNIMVPSTAVRHPAMARELLAFLVLHELGHVLWDSSGTQNEAHADAWAVEVGMRAMFPAGSDYLRAVDRVQEQLQAYFEAVYPPDALAAPHRTGQLDDMNDYPALACRKALIGLLPHGTPVAPPPTGGTGTTTAREAVEAGIATYLDGNGCWNGAVPPPGHIGDTHCGTDCPPRSGSDSDLPAWEVPVGPGQVPHHLRDQWAAVLAGRRQQAAAVAAIGEFHRGLCIARPELCRPADSTRHKVKAPRWLTAHHRDLRRINAMARRMDRRLAQARHRMARAPHLKAE